MSKPKAAPLFRLVMGGLFSDSHSWEAALEQCVERFGPVEMTVGPMPFTFTKYYCKEMGEEIQRVFLLFVRPFPPDGLVDAKLFTNSVEDALASEGNRRVNLDPGVVTPWNLVLATGKPRHQRIYLGKGIYGDLTLIYSAGAFRPLEWSYPDWGGPEVQELLKRARSSLVSRNRR